MGDVWDNYFSDDFGSELDGEEARPQDSSLDERAQAVHALLTEFARTMTAPVRQWRDAHLGGDYGNISFAPNYNAETAPEKRELPPEKILRLSQTGDRLRRALDEFLEGLWGEAREMAERDAQLWVTLQQQLTPAELMRFLREAKDGNMLDITLRSTDPVGIMLGRSTVPSVFKTDVAHIAVNPETGLGYREALRQLVKQTVGEVEQLPVVLPDTTRQQLLAASGRGKGAA